MEMVFEYQLPEERKVNLAAIEFSDYAVTWWDQLVVSTRRNRERPIDTWDEMKPIMRKRCVPSHYYRNLFNKLQRLSQGSKSVDEYYKEMEIAMMRANVEEDREATMARFLHGLNPDIADVVEMHQYVHQAQKVEEQLKRKGVAKRGKSGASSSSWKSPYKKEEYTPKPKSDPSKFPKPSTPTPSKAPITLLKTREIKCFRCHGLGHYASQCPNKRALFINAQGELETKDEKEEEDEDEESEEEDGEEQVAAMGELLVARRILSAQTKEDKNQRENLFHTRGLVNGKICSIIIDGGSCTNAASCDMVEKLGLTTEKHLKPYRLQWLNDQGEVKVNKQVRIPF